MVFKLLAPYSQEQNKVSKQVGKTIINIIKVTILKKTLTISSGQKLYLLWLISKIIA